MNGFPAQGRIELYVFLLTIGTALLCPPAVAADPAAGRTLFRQQCSVCHTA
jgi:mono/diheme cytochrome c family protein